MFNKDNSGVISSTNNMAFRARDCSVEVFVTKDKDLQSEIEGDLFR